MAWMIFGGLLLFFFLVGACSNKSSSPRDGKTKRQREALAKYQPTDGGKLLSAKRQLPKRIQFWYKDAEGEETERAVRPVSIDESGQIRAWCELRRAERTFYVHRIMGHRAVDTSTGEEFDPRELVPRPREVASGNNDFVISVEIKEQKSGKRTGKR